MIDLTMDMEQYDCPFIDTTDDHQVAFSAVHWEFDTAAEQLQTRLVVEGEDRSALDSGLSAVREHDNMRAFELVSRVDDAAHVNTVIAQTDAMETIRGHDGYITGPFHVEDGSETWHVGFDQAAAADGALAALERNNEYEVLERDSVELADLQEFVQHAGAAMTLIEGCRDLSATERETLEAAVTEGYFESPRSATLGTLADRFDVSKPAVSKNLRRGQQKTLERIVDAIDDLDE
jgi:predicted DNA binding protein